MKKKEIIKDLWEFNKWLEESKSQEKWEPIVGAVNQGSTYNRGLNHAKKYVEYLLKKYS